MSEVQGTAGVLGGLFRKPLKKYENLVDETITVLSSPRDLLYIRNCYNCKFTVTGSCAKATIERCTVTEIEFQQRVMSGTLEVMYSDEVTVRIAPGQALPTISLDNSNRCHLYLHDMSAIGIIHTVWVEEIVVHFDPPYPKDYKVEHPVGEEGEFLTKYSFGKLFTSRGIREGGGYLCTIKEKELADKKQEEFDKKMIEYVTKMVASATAGSGKPPINDTKKPDATKPVSSQPDTTTSTTSSSDNGDGTIGADSLLNAKGKLKPTETVERKHPVVGTSSGGGRGYNIKDDVEKKEFFDKPDILENKVKKVANWVKSSKHVIFFTGAGISTSAGIPDFRSGMNTVLPTGPGVWELQEKGVPRNNPKILPILKALPTSTHMSIVKMHESGHVKFTVSQNVDGIHRRSGLSPDQLAELHGNTNLETCSKCRRQYLRDFETREALHVFDHATSRQCDVPTCKGQLLDSIINFGENLPENELRKAFDHAQKADLCIVLGSSLRVRPACQVPEVVLGNKGKVVICNLQDIPHFPSNSDRSLQVYSMCDEFMKRLMHELQLPIPKFLLSRRVKIYNEKTQDDTIKVTVTGVDVNEDIPYSFIQTVTNAGTKKILDPFDFSFPPNTNGPIELTLSFHGHYREPPLMLSYNLDDGVCFYKLAYDVQEGEWHSLMIKQ